MTRSSTARELVPMVLEGRAQAASSLAMEALEKGAVAGTGTAAMEQATLAADLMLAQDCAEEAEDLYRQALTAAAAAPRGQVRVASCRNTGFLCLYQRRYGAAVASFARVVEDDAATLAQRVEALAGAALTHHALGRSDMAAAAMDDASARLSAAGPHDAADNAALRLFLRLVRIELSVQYAIRTNAVLADHIFWQSDSACTRAHHSDSDLACELRDGMATVAGHPLLARRLQYLLTLVQACMGHARALAPAHEHLSWLRRMHLAAAERQYRIEGALAAIVAHDAELARSLLEPLSGRQAEGPQRWNFELSYCRAKLCEMAGQNDECLRHYQRYAMESVMCLRNEVQKMPAVKVPNPRAGEARDEVELALPARYRRAYRYLLAQMDRADLSVREIAGHIGVSERAVQSAFRCYLGMTPIEVLRRSRIERIHDDLLQSEGCGSSVLETAARWGIRNRSTLVSSYRKHFRETPADTLARREPAPTRTA
ncbi:helix-turn-helix transcriptional regulator [Ramlibacter tataouinensis]|nr:helix-turn-helix transcriptional regulator [Ramlibacter tataouinensis]